MLAKMLSAANLIINSFNCSWIGFPTVQCVLFICSAGLKPLGSGLGLAMESANAGNCALLWCQLHMEVHLSPRLLEIDQKSS